MLGLSNEVLAFIFMLFYLGCAVGFYTLGKAYLQSFLVLSYVITLCITSRFFDFFGLTSSAGIITYAGIFLATDMLTERYGKAAGFQTVRIGFLVSLTFVVMTQANLLFTPLPFVQEMSDAMDIVFGSSVRLAVAGFSVYLFAQHFDVWLFHKISEVTQGKHLWLRNNLSTIISQFLDTVLFFGIAFYGTMENGQLINLTFTAFGLKMAIAILDTPFIYLSKKITPLDLRPKP